MKRPAKSLQEVNASVPIPVKRGFWKTLLAFLGPAYMVSVGYMDPGNWATDIAAGSKFGYQLIWVLLMSNIMALLLQSLAARLGIVKGLDLAQASRIYYPKWANISLYALAEIAIIACDLAEIIGMAIGLQLLFHIPLGWGVIITALDTFLLMFLINKGIRKMEAFILALITVIGVSFVIELLIVKPDLTQVAVGLIPTSLSDGALYIAIGIIGATVMPHNLYLHSSLVQTRQFKRDETGIRKAIRFNLIDSGIALNLAFFVNAAILILAGTAFYQSGYYHVSDIQDAHLLLANLFGTLAPALFAIALIAAGQSSTITGTLAGQIIMEGYLNLRFSPWIRRLVTRLLAIAPALLTIFLYGENRMGDLLVLSQVVLSMQLGFAVIPLIHFTANKKLMGKFTISKGIIVFASVCASVIVVLNALLVYQETSAVFSSDAHLVLKSLLAVVILYTVVLLLYIVFYPLFNTKKQNEYEAKMHRTKAHFIVPEARQYSCIAIAVDFSRSDETALQYALQMGGKQARYILVHVVESAGALKMREEIADAESKEDTELLSNYMNQLNDLGYQTEIKLGYGKSGQAIVTMINQSDAELLVLGSHGHKGFKDFIFGTTADVVRHGVTIPVLIVKPDK